ncbi:MAG: peptidoglycan bridge formation glycyltransferase FemA/FemB family protein [Patescibacteria group bacterium]
MELQINQGLDRQSWDYFVLQHPDGNLLQSWVWGEFQKNFGYKIWRLAVTSEGQTLAQLLVIKIPLKFGLNIFYAPRAILINKTQPANHQHTAMKLIINYLKKIASKEKAILFRTDPPLPPDDSTALSIYKSLGFVVSPKSTQPKTNLWLDIRPKEPNLLLQMKPKTRYNIRLSEKHNIRVHATQKPEEITIFNDLIHTTSIRDSFHSHPDNYYTQQFFTLSKYNSMSLFVAEYNGQPLATALVSFFGHTATYLHGASSGQHRDKQPTYALHWEIIKTAKQHDCTIYDLGGVNLSTHHAWAGITRFKLGFGGNIVDYIGNLELPLNKPWFKLYQLLVNKSYD